MEGRISLNIGCTSSGLSPDEAGGRLASRKAKPAARRIRTRSMAVTSRTLNERRLQDEIETLYKIRGGVARRVAPGDRRGATVLRAVDGAITEREQAIADSIRAWAEKRELPGG